MSSRHIRGYLVYKNYYLHTIAGDVTAAMMLNNSVLLVRKASGAATAFTIPTASYVGQAFIIVDAKGDAATNNITITGTAGNINGSATLVISENYGSVELIWDGSNWFINGQSNSVSTAEMAFLNGVTAGTVTASKAVVVDANKDVSSFRDIAVRNLDAGASATAGTVDVFPTTAARGKLAITAADSAGDTTTTIVNASQAGAVTYTIPDAGASASFVMTAGAQTLAGVKTLTSVPVVNPATGTPGGIDLQSTTDALGTFRIVAANSAGDTVTTITHASQSGARTYTIPDLGASGNFVLASAFSQVIDGVAMSTFKWVDVTVTAALLDAAGSVNVIAGVSGDQYKIREVRLVGGGTNFGAGGDRLISLTDGTTVWTTIANADIESAPAVTLHWGDTKVPYLTGTSDTASASAAAIRFQYSGGSADHTTGSIKFSVCLEKIA